MQPSSQQLANALRVLAMDAVEQAQSGHPGAPMGMADIAQVLWQQHLKHNPNDPMWSNRDRFVLSNGHGSMLLYALLHLSGYALPIEELQNFRQLHSKTPGHPELDMHIGVETTTGPLGQGLANAVGMALAEKLLGQEFNRQDLAIVDHFTYVFVGDGCLMEGISHEVCSFAGVCELGKLIVIYDDNGISIDGDVTNWFRDNTKKRFESYQWHVIDNVDGHDPDSIHKALIESKAQKHHPSLICCKTTIGKGAPNKQGSAGVHGTPLGADEIAATREQLGWSSSPFVIPEHIQNAWDAKQIGNTRQQHWQKKFDRYTEKYPDLAREYQRRISTKLSPQLLGNLSELASNIVTQAIETNIATRKASYNALNELSAYLPELLGGSADLTGSNLTNFKGHTAYLPGKWGNHISYGVREFGMAAMMNGIALHGGYLPYGGTFLTFSDYSRNAIRMAALMRLRVVHVFTHDSIGVGEDGPTHQSIEHLPSLRLIPHLDLWRPADALETYIAWCQAICKTDGPSALALSRQSLPNIHTTTEHIQNIAKGGYILQECDQPQIVLIATGSEVHLAIEAYLQLTQQHISVQVVSMPCCEVFDRQDSQYKRQVIPPHIPKIIIEAAVGDLWNKYIDGKGKIIGIHRYGESAPANQLFAHFAITSSAIVQACLNLLEVS